jgi:hypothetical protein
LILAINFKDLLDNPLKFFGDIVEITIQNFIIKALDDIVRWPLQFLHDHLAVPTLGGDAVFANLGKYARDAALILVTIFFVIRLINGMKDNITGENNGANYAEITGSYLISYVLIFATPYILTEFLMPVNTQLLKDLPFIVLDTGQPVDHIIDPEEGISGLIKGTDFPGWLYIFVVIIVFFAVLGFCLSVAILQIEIFLLWLMGPLLATTYQNRSQAYRMYWTECVVAVFTQSLQYLLFLLMLVAFRDGNLFLAIGIIVVSIRGPQVLRQFLQNASVPGAGLALGVGRMAVLRGMFKMMGK